MRRLPRRRAIWHSFISPAVVPALTTHVSPRHHPWSALAPKVDRNAAIRGSLWHQRCERRQPWQRHGNGFQGLWVTGSRFPPLLHGPLRLHPPAGESQLRSGADGHSPTLHWAMGGYTISQTSLMAKVSAGVSGADCRSVVDGVASPAGGFSNRRLSEMPCVDKKHLLE